MSDATPGLEGNVSAARDAVAILRACAAGDMAEADRILAATPAPRALAGDLAFITGYFLRSLPGHSLDQYLAGALKVLTDHALDLELKRQAAEEEADRSPG
jgi:hypothetical protein